MDGGSSGELASTVVSHGMRMSTGFGLSSDVRMCVRNPVLSHWRLRASRRAARSESRLDLESPIRMLASTRRALSVPMESIGGSGSTAFTALYEYFCCSLNG